MECVHCRGNLAPGRVTYTAHRRRYLLLLDDIAGWTCQQCGEPVFEERVVEAIQQFLRTLDAGMEPVGYWIATQPRPVDSDNRGEVCMDTPRDVIGRGGEEIAMTPQQAAKCLRDWATKHSKALTGINAVESIREARENR
jgi:YgiT-type zinc finger domain-containing protein